jgi:hypothetical protein
VAGATADSPSTPAVDVEPTRQGTDTDAP